MQLRGLCCYTPEGEARTAGCRPLDSRGELPQRSAATNATIINLVPFVPDRDFDIGEDAQKKFHLDARLRRARNDQVAARLELIETRRFRASAYPPGQLLPYPLAVVTGVHRSIPGILPQLQHYRYHITTLRERKHYTPRQLQP